MRYWGVLITAFYIVVVLCLIIPGVMRISSSGTATFQDYVDLGQEPLFWMWMGILVAGQTMLLFLSVDASAKRLRPRQHVLLSVATVAAAIALLTGAAIYSGLAGLLGDSGSVWDVLLGSRARPFVSFLALWAFWGIIFYLYAKGTPIAVTRLVSWLLKGSVIELLIAVPCHVVVRRRGDCSAPLLSGYGIATGLAIMLLSFGPSVLFLYRKRLKQYNKPAADPTSADGSGEDQSRDCETTSGTRGE